MTISRSYALSINILLIFEMHDLNGILFAAATKRSIVSFTRIYESR